MVDTAEPDVVVVDADDRVVMLVEVKTAPSNRAHDALASMLAREAHARYAMHVDMSEIEVYRWDGRRLDGPVVRLPTAEVLCAYDPEFSSKRIYGFYLETLVQGWLRDVAYHWNSETPPGYEELERAGVAQLLAGGSAHTLVSVSEL
jgi:hypothetical protein